MICDSISCCIMSCKDSSLSTKISAIVFIISVVALAVLASGCFSSGLCRWFPVLNMSIGSFTVAALALTAISVVGSLFSCCEYIKKYKAEIIVCIEIMVVIAMPKILSYCAGIACAGCFAIFGSGCLLSLYLASALVLFIVSYLICKQEDFVAITSLEKTKSREALLQEMQHVRFPLVNFDKFDDLIEKSKVIQRTLDSILEEKPENEQMIIKSIKILSEAINQLETCKVSVQKGLINKKSSEITFVLSSYIILVEQALCCFFFQESEQMDEIMVDIANLQSLAEQKKQSIVK